MLISKGLASSSPVDSVKQWESAHFSSHLCLGMWDFFYLFTRQVESGSQAISLMSKSAETVAKAVVLLLLQAFYFIATCTNTRLHCLCVPLPQ